MGGKISVSSQTWCYGNFQLTRILKRMPGPDISDQTDRDYDIEGNEKFIEREMNKSSPPVPTVMFNIDGPNISPIEIGEGQIPVLLWNRIGKHLHFVKTIQEETTLMRKDNF